MRRWVIVIALVFAFACTKRKKGPSYKAELLVAQGSAACAIMQDKSVRCWGSQGGEFPQLLEQKAVTACVSDELLCTTIGARGRCGARELPDALEIGCQGNTPCALSAVRDRVSCVDASFFAPRVRMIASGPSASCALLEDATARCWGSNADGVLGDGTTERREGIVTPKIDHVAAIAMGARHACAALDNGLVACWGRNTHGQLGDGTFTDHFAPQTVASLAGIDEIAAGGEHTCAHRLDDTIRCWGADDHHQLGLGGEPMSKPSPTLVPGLYEATGVACGDAFTCALMGDGWVRCWGANEVGQIGDGTKLERAVPVPIRF